VFDDSDHQHMRHALALAARGLETTMPNPRVGCVLVRDGQVVGAGWHERAGAAHAEAAALAVAGARARGATAYVTLEPCDHHGRTPPCSEALIRAGVAQVVMAMPDPNPGAAGGAGRLRAAGIVVRSGLLEDEARELNLGYVSRLIRGRPWMRLKLAATLDGRTALPDGRSRWITGQAARADAHRWRARSCAVLTGIGTVRDDDPQLTVRAVPAGRQPLRVVLDSRLEIAPAARVLDGGGTLVFAAVADAARIGALEARGAEVVVLPDRAGQVDLAAMAVELGRRGLNEVLVESGSRLNGALLRAGLVDELLVYVAPRLIGERGRGMFDLPELADLESARALEFRDVTRCGADLRIVARPVP
jgi:diaminohydroxyphosphoribosylaminopyrimidine deaminase/5-amino-6-(5-phosphoribosylamino)uracil reductase